MLKLEIGMPDKTGSISKGFTLIEILIVLLIIGIVSGVAVSHFGDFGESRRIKIAAEDFLSFFKKMQHRAIIESNPIGVSIEKNVFKLFRLNQHGRWEAQGPAAYRPPLLPPTIILTLKSQLKNSYSEPGIVIYNSGDISEFQLHFGTRNKLASLKIMKDASGDLCLYNATSEKN